MYPNLNRDFASFGSVYAEQAIVVSSLRKLTQAQMSGCNLASYRVFQIPGKEMIMMHIHFILIRSFLPIRKIDTNT